jgi:hypothetical protein
LTSTTSSASDLIDLKFCNSDSTSAHVKYDPVTDVYGLIDCTGGTKQVTDVKGILSATCPSDFSGATCYKVNR